MYATIYMIATMEYSYDASNGYVFHGKLTLIVLQVTKPQRGNTYVASYRM